MERAKQEREGIIIRAEGEAQSARMVGEAIRSNPGFLQLRRLEAAREIAQTLRTSNNRVFLSADTLMVNVNDDSYGPGAPGDGVSAVARTHGTSGCVAVAAFHAGRSTRWANRRRASKHAANPNLDAAMSRPLLRAVVDAVDYVHDLLEKVHGYSTLCALHDVARYMM